MVSFVRKKQITALASCQTNTALKLCLENCVLVTDSENILIGFLQGRSHDPLPFPLIYLYFFKALLLPIQFQIKGTPICSNLYVGKIDLLLRTHPGANPTQHDQPWTNRTQLNRE